MDDDADLHRYGTPLEPLEKDEVPAKKPLAIEDQIVKDENGKRRFHGAFTGGFSAGFWNTVGSLEGWTPQSFKSSRGDRAQQRTQLRPEDFMDTEDLGEFGIAPQGIRTREEFSKDGDDKASSSKKRKLQQQGALGAIPGVPVLVQLLKPVRDKVAVRILRSMGWKPGQGVGPRQTRKEKNQTKARNKREQYLLQHYGMDDTGPALERHTSADEGEDEDGDNDDEEITFAPDDYEPLFYNVKDNRFGLSYSGLSRAPVLSKGEHSAVAASQHINLFGTLETLDKQKKLSITGQAFGVGALEEEDDDIYARDDMNLYDFSLGGKAQKKQKKSQHVQERSVIEGFASDKTEVTYNEPYSIDLPRDFRPRNWAQRRSRFAPLAPELAQQLAAAKEYKKAGLGRHDLDAAQRAALLGEQVPAVAPKPDRAKALLERINATGKNFTRGGVITAEGEERTAPPTSDAVAQHVQLENAKLVAKAANKTQHLVTTPSGGFKPFLGDEGKQTRYDKFLASELKDEAQIAKFLDDLQPVTLTAWDREMEMKEFMQARSIYKPLAGVMSDRFVAEAGVVAEAIKPADAPKQDKKVVVVRSQSMWKPSAHLCKRYNIAEPFGGALPESEKPLIHKPKMSVFNYLELSVNTKANFQTPVIIPKHVAERPKPLPVAAPAAPPVAAPATPAPLADTSEQAAAAADKEDKPAPASATKIAKYAPKSELEKRVEACKHKPISEKTDLFKSIFDDSDDEEQEAASAHASADGLDVSPGEKRLAAMRAELGLPDVSQTTNAAAANELRNISKPRGIFAELFQAGEETAETATAEPTASEDVSATKSTNLAPPKVAFRKRSERQLSEKEDTEHTSATTSAAALAAEEAAFYGPKLPERLQTPTPSLTKHARESDIDAQLQKLWMLQKTTESGKSKKFREDRWVEKTLASIDSSEATSSGSESHYSGVSDKHAKKKKSKKSKQRELDSKKSHKKAKKKSKKSAKTRVKTHKHKKTK